MQNLRVQTSTSIVVLCLLTSSPVVLAAWGTGAVQRRTPPPECRVWGSCPFTGEVPE
jgi:hypothetical protein